jgi:predicted nucleotidyltransferase
MDRRDIERIALTLAEAHGCHTTILYGSHARGDATASSDVDFACIREGGPSVRYAEVVYVDAFVYPEAALETLEPSMLRLLGGVVLRERDGFGSALLARLRDLDERGPAAMPDDERRALVVWSQKMLERIRGSGVDADYRRMSLVVQALEDYFTLRGAWFRGSKEAFAWLRENDRAAYGAFERAGRADAGGEAFSELVAAVYGGLGPTAR